MDLTQHCCFVFLWGTNRACLLRKKMVSYSKYVDIDGTVSSNRAKPANLPKNPSQMPREYPLYMLVVCFICLMINTYHFYLNSAFNCKQNKDIFRVCYMTSRAIKPVPESARVEKRTVVESLAKVIVLASEISRIIVEAVKVLENIVLCSSESSRELS